MEPKPSLLRVRFVPLGVLAVAAAACLAAAGEGGAQGDGEAQLKIGSSSSMMPGKKNKQEEEAAVKTLQEFIKDETKLTNKIDEMKGWKALADALAGGKVQLGAFQGYEFAWAQKLYPDLKVAAIAVNVTRYPVAIVYTNKANGVKQFGDLKGKTFSIPDAGSPFLKLFVAKQVQDLGKGEKLDTFFGKVTHPTNFADALNDVIDKNVFGAVVDDAVKDAFMRRNKVRFAELQEVVVSDKFPPSLIAYSAGKGGIDDATLKKVQDGLLNADKTDRGQQMMTLFRLTKFEPPPADFGKVLADTLKAFPPPKD